MIRLPLRSTLFPYTTLFRSLPAQVGGRRHARLARRILDGIHWAGRSEEHTSELQSHSDLVCRLLLEKKNTISPPAIASNDAWIQSASAESTFNSETSLGLFR